LFFWTQLLIILVAYLKVLEVLSELIELLLGHDADTTDALRSQGFVLLKRDAQTVDIRWFFFDPVDIKFVVHQVGFLF
jgi:hypothetical protein